MRVILAIVASLSLSSVAPSLAQDILGAAQAIDGDSLLIAGRPIRLGGIDAPEYQQTCTTNGIRWPCGRAAKSVMASLIAGRTVACADTGQRSFKRIVAICFVDGEDLGGRMIALGWAQDIPKFSGGRYSERETAARAAGLGAWAGGVTGFQNPALWRAEHAKK